MQTIVSTLLNRPLVALLLASLCLLPGIKPLFAGQSNPQIRQAIRTYALTTLAAEDVTIGQLDSRLRLTACTAPLRVFLPRGAQSIGKSTVGVQCDDLPGWKIYIPVQLKHFAQVAVARHPLPRDTIVGKNDIEMQRKDLSLLNYGYFKSADEVVGMQLKRAIQGGESLSPGNLKPRRMVQRGDLITILAEVQGLTVRVKGSALADGYRGEAIRVKNQRSKRILQAEVIAPGIVRVRL